MKQGRRFLAALIVSIKTIVTTLSSLSLMFAGSHVHAAPATAHSPLLSQTQAAQASIARIVSSIKAAGDGSVTEANIRASIAEAVAGNPGATIDMLAGAINQLILNDAALAASVHGGADAFGTELTHVITAIITDTYMMQGREAAHAQAARLRIALGRDAVDIAMQDLPVTTFQTLDELRNIEPASGIYDG